MIVLIFKQMGTMRSFCIAAFLVFFMMFPLFTSVNGRFHAATMQPVYFTAPVSNNNAHVTRNYDRIEDVERACEPVLDSASDLEANDNRAYSIWHDLSFGGGDWEQEDGTRPLLPFVDGVGPYVLSDSSLNYSDTSIHGFPFRLAWFTITDVDHAHRSRKTISVNGVLNLIITRDGPLPEFVQGGSSEPAPQFQMWSGHTQVPIFFQGVYTESEKNGGERVMCLLGNAMLPRHQSGSADPWGQIKTSDSMYYQPPLTKDDNILLTLHYPKTFTLTKRAIRGEMRSLNLKTDLKYFDEVHISSQLNGAEYQFGPLTELSKACDPYPYSDNFTDGIDIYKGPDFCSIFEAIQHEATLFVMPNWKCNGTDEFCSKLGPFANDTEIIGAHGGFNDVKLLMQDVRCEQMPVKDKITMARVSLVLRAVPPHQRYYVASRRNGLGNMTLAAEGIWKSSKGQLCMVGCRGILDAEQNACDSRVCFYIPTAFSIKQRAALLGTISSINTKTPSYFPLSFQFPVQNALMWQFDRYTNFHYKYSKLSFAGAFLEKNEAFSFGNVIKKSLLKFPMSQENEDYNSSFSLGEDLSFDASAIPDPYRSHPRTYVRMNILSVGSMLSPYSFAGNFSFSRAVTSYSKKAEYTQKQLLVNVSAQLSIRREAYSNFSSLSVEGLYDPVVGKLYLIGCRIVRASWKILFDSNDLDGGSDCSIEVVISYPPVTAQWLVNPTAEISITSQRVADDPLYFKPVKLRASPIMYRRQREDILSERGIEAFLRVLTLSLAIACIVTQLFYIIRRADSAPYVSLVMLGVEALGYGLPLITDVESLFRKKHSNSYASPVYGLENDQLIHAIDSTVKLLVLIAFLLITRLFQKVWKSRARSVTQAPPEPRQVPNDKVVLAITLIIHIAGFIYVLIVCAPNTSQPRFFSEFDSTGSSRKARQWLILLEEYVGLVRDLFLLPQVVGNLIWRINCKPLSKLYYIGVTIIRLLPHVYDYLEVPTANPYFSRDYEFVNPDLDFYSKSSDILIPLMAVILALLVYVQQRWSYDKLSNTLVIGSCRLLPAGPKSYQKLPSESFEAELATAGNGTNMPDQRA